MAANYPDGVDTAGPTIARLMKQPLEFPAALFDRNEDGGVDVNVVPCGLRVYVLEYEGLSVSDLNLIRAHYNDARGKVEEFNFYDRQSATLLPNCKYRDFKIGKHQKVWAGLATVTIERFE